MFPKRVALFSRLKFVSISCKLELNCLYWATRVVYSCHNDVRVLLAFVYAGSLVFISESAFTSSEKVMLYSLERERKLALAWLYVKASALKEETEPL